MQKSFCFAIVLLINISFAINAQNDSLYYDLLHPRYYTRVIELDSKKDTCKIIWTENSEIKEKVFAEVDYRSKILIEFNKEVIQPISRQFDGEISIEGSKNGEPIEIPSYSIIGEETKTSPVFLRSGDIVKNSLLKINEQFGNFDTDLHDFVDKPIPNKSSINNYLSSLINEENKSNLQKIEKLKLDKIKLESEKIALSSYLTDNREKKILEIDKSMIAEKKDTTSTDSLKLENLKFNIYLLDSIQSISEEIEKIDENYNILNAELSQYDKEVSKTRTYIEIELPNIRRKILANTILKTHLITISDEKNFIVLGHICKISAEKDPNVVKDYAKQIIDKYLVELDSLKLNPIQADKTDSIYQTDKADLIYQILEKMRTTMSLIHQSLSIFTAFKDINYEELTNRLLTDLKRTEILLPKINARVNDKILITIKFKMNDAPRTLDILLEVKEFGLVNKVTDSFFLLKPLYPSDKNLNNIDSSDVGGTFIDTKHYTPSAGVSYFWTWYIRDTGWLSNIGRFLTPGFGLNISFPTYKPKIVRFNTQVVLPDTSIRTLVIEETENTFNVAFGIVFSFFDNALQFTGGWNLTSGTGKQRYYFGLGFSFINLARRISGS